MMSSVIESWFLISSRDPYLNTFPCKLNREKNKKGIKLYMILYNRIIIVIELYMIKLYMIMNGT
jgi:hypothetical protein